jgi:hypothetical protein
MVKLGDEYREEKREKPRNKWQDFGEFLEDHWWGLLIGALIISWLIGDIGDVFKPNVPIVKEQAVVIEYVEDAEFFDHYKIQFLSDRSVRMEDLDNGIAVGDTISIER